MSEQQDIGMGGPVGSPIVKFRLIGQSLIGALVDVEKRQQMRWKNGQTDGLAWKEDGKPAMELILHVLVQPGTTAMRSSEVDPSGYETLEPGTLARVILKGFKWGQYIESRNSTPGMKGEKTGDLITLTYRNGSCTNRAGNRIELHTEADIAAVPRDVIVGKDMTVGVARPGAGQGALIDACNAARAERKAQVISDEVRTGQFPAPPAATPPALAARSEDWLVGGAAEHGRQAATTATATADRGEPPF